MMPNLHIKFHQNPLNSLGEVVLTRYMNGQKDGRTDMVISIYPQTLFVGGININTHISRYENSESKWFL